MNPFTYLYAYGLIFLCSKISSSFQSRSEKKKVEENPQLQLVDHEMTCTIFVCIRVRARRLPVGRTHLPPLLKMLLPPSSSILLFCFRGAGEPFSHRLGSALQCAIGNRTSAVVFSAAYSYRPHCIV